MSKLRIISFTYLGLIDEVQKCIGDLCGFKVLVLMEVEGQILKFYCHICFDLWFQVLGYRSIKENEHIEDLIF